MARKAPQSRKKIRRQNKAATVRKLSPEQPAARDEGPRLIPLGPAKDAGLGRIEHYLELADKALGPSPVKSTEETSQKWGSAVHDSDADPAEELPPSPMPLAVPASSPYPPRLTVPKLPSLPRPPKPPKLSIPRPPRVPALPRPPKLSLPKPPRRSVR